MLRAVNECAHEDLEAGISPLAEEWQQEGQRNADPVIILQLWMAAARGAHLSTDRPLFSSALMQLSIHRPLFNSALMQLCLAHV